MRTAIDPINNEAVTAEDLVNSAYRSSTPGALYRCPDPKCADPRLIWKPGNGRKSAHWAHYPGTPPCGGVGMTAIHLAAQHSILAWTKAGFLRWAKAEQDLPIPNHALRTLQKRRLDVAGICPIEPGSDLRLGIEVQHSQTHLAREENRIRDINLTGTPVLMTVTAENLKRVSGTTARVPSWVQEWTRRHGRRQLAVIDNTGQLHWVWFAQNQPIARTCDIVERAAITPGMLSQCGQYRLSLCVDETRPAVKSSPSLLIAAFAWVEVHPTAWKSWPSSALAPPRKGGPRRLPRPIYLGPPHARKMFPPSCMSVGGF